MTAKFWRRLVGSSLTTLLLVSGSVFAADKPADTKPGVGASAPAPAVVAPAQTPAPAVEAPKPKEKTAVEKLKDARDSLEAAAKKAGLDMKRVKKFCDALEARKTTYSVTDEQITAAYKAVEEMLTATEKSPFCDMAERKKLAEETMHNLGVPTDIDQGSHPTCNVTTLEVYMASRYPDVYADMVKQLAITQKYKTKAGETISMPRAALMPGIDEKAFDIDKPNNDKRSRASQFVENTLVNGVYQTGRYKRGGKAANTDWQYVMGPQNIHTEWDPQWGWVTIYDTEDQMLDGKGNRVNDSNGKPLDSPSFTTEEILEASDMVLGHKMPYIAAPYQIQGQPWVYDLPDAQRLLKLNKDGKLPLGVPTLGGVHVQTIHDVFVDKNGQCWVLIDNQHGAADDGWVTLQELHANQQSSSHKMKPQKAHP